MKKSRIPLFTALLVMAALILTSCGGLTSARKETGSFNYTISPELLEQLARNAGDADDWEYKIVVNVRTENDDSYFDTQTAWFNAEDYESGEFRPTATGLTFEDIPLNKTMLLRVHIYKNFGDKTCIWATKVPDKFTIDNATMTTAIRTKLSEPVDLPYTFSIEGPDGTGKILKISANTSFQQETDSLTTLSTSTLSISDRSGIISCFTDMNGTQWCLYSISPEYNVFEYYISAKDAASTHTAEVVYQGEAQGLFGFYGLFYDSMKNRICLYGGTHLGATQSKVYFMTAINPADYSSIEGTLSITEEDIIPLTGNTLEISSPGYVENGYFYCLTTNDTEYTKDSINTNIMKFTLEDRGSHHAGELIKTGSVSIDRINPIEDATILEEGMLANDDYLNAVYEDGNGERTSYDTDRFFFNDIAVYDDSVYILFHQEEFWADPGSISYNEHLDPEAYQFQDNQNGGYINRGGILVIDADTLTTKETLGLTEVKDSQQVPLVGHLTWRTPNYTYLGTTYAFFYEDSAMTKVVWGDFPLKFAIPEWNSKAIYFSNPIKIVAVKPKKLVVADSGVFLFIDDDRDADGNPVIKQYDFEENRYLVRVKNATRLITVDLEDFSDSKVSSIITEAEPLYYSGTANELENFFYLWYKGDKNSTSVYYYPEVEFTEPESHEYYRTGNAITFTGNGGSDFNIQTELDLPF